MSLSQSKEDDALIKVTDFGFARRVHAPQSLTSRCGTVRIVILCGLDETPNIPTDTATFHLYACPSQLL